MLAFDKRIMTRATIIWIMSGIAVGLCIPMWGAEPAGKRKDKVVDSDKVAEQADWLKKNATVAEDYVVSLFKTHQAIIFGEQHNIREHKTFVAGLIGRLYAEADVRCFAWEFSCPEDNERLERLVTAKEFDETELLAFARDQYIDWNSADHWDLIRAVWGVNHARPPGKPPMRMVGLRSRRFIDANQEWHTVQRGSQRFWELLEFLRQGDDAGMAREVERHVIEPNVKGLVFVGRDHDMTKYTYPSSPPKWFLKQLGTVKIPEGLFPPDKPFRTTMGRLLYQKHGDRVFHVWLGAGLIPGIEVPMTAARLSNLGFTVEGSPFENVESRPEFFTDPAVPMKVLAQGFVSLGDHRELHANRVIPGFVSEDMFQRYREYYEMAFERSFCNAQEVDEYLQKHRWPARKE